MKKQQDSDPVEYHFSYETIKLGQDDTVEETVLTEPVRKGALLASLSENEEDAVPFELVAGQNCELSSAGDSILACLCGYPKWDKDDSDACAISLSPLCSVSNDAMSVDMTLYPPLSGKKLNVEDLKEFLEIENIKIGIDELAIADAISAVQESGGEPVTFVAAKGVPCVNGDDAYVKLEVELGSTIGTMKEDGSLDFKERRMFVYVDEGQLIARLIPATSGTPGKNVYGASVEAKPGKDVTVRVTEDAVFDEQTGMVTAGRGGIVSVVNDTNFKVTTKQTISGDIDYSTGNIYAKNSVNITGNIKPGFVVAVRGDIQIGGHVESATVNSHGNLVVRGGVLGEQSHLNIRGDVDLSYVEKATVLAAGNIVLKKDAYYSRIEAGGNILGGGSSKIVGGRIVCGGNLHVTDIGSASADPSFIAVGTHSKRLEKYENRQERIEEIEAMIFQFYQRRGKAAKKSSKVIELEEELHALQKELRNLNLISGTPEQSLKDEAFEECMAELIVSGRITSGTILRIGNVKITVEKDLLKQKFAIDGFLKTIVARSL